MSTGVLMLIGGGFCALFGLLLIIMSIKAGSVKNKQVKSMPTNVQNMHNANQHMDNSMNQQMNPQMNPQMNQFSAQYGKRPMNQPMNQSFDDFNNFEDNNFGSQDVDIFASDEVDIFNPNFESKRQAQISRTELKPKQSNIDLDDDLEDF